MDRGAEDPAGEDRSQSVGLTVGLFSNKRPASDPPLRRDKVIKAIKADMDFESAIDRDLDGAAWVRVRKAHDDAIKGLTPAERKQVDDARQRHGYGG